MHLFVQYNTHLHPLIIQCTQKSGIGKNLVRIITVQKTPAKIFCTD